MFEKLPDSISQVPQYSFGPYVYRQPSLLPAAIVNALAPAVEKMAENLDPATRQQRELDKKEREYKTTLLDRQLQHLNGGAEQLDADGIPLYDETGAPMSYEKKQDLLYKKALTSRALREPVGRAPAKPAAQPGDRFYLPTNGMPKVGPNGLQTPDLPPIGSDRPEPVQLPSASAFPDIKLDLTTGVPKMSLSDNRPMPLVGGPLIADRGSASSIPDMTSVDDQVMSTDNAAPTSDETVAAAASASEDAVDELQQQPPAGPRTLKGQKAPDLGEAESANPDGSWNTTTGVIYFPKDGHVEKVVPGGRITWSSPLADPLFFPDVKPTKHKTQLLQATDPVTHEVKTQLIDMDPSTPNDKRVITELNPTTRAAVQAENLRLRMVNAAKTQPGLIGYINVKNNYDSLLENSAIPEDRRTGADDAVAIQAFGAIEHPSTGVTDADKKQAAALAGRISAIKLELKNWMKDSSRTLTAKAVKEMATAAKRALEGRQKTYNEQIAPLIAEGKRLGLSPAEINGALGITHGDIAGGDKKGAAAPAVSPSATPDKKAAVPAQAAYNRAQEILADTNSTPEARAQAEKVLVSLRARGLLPDTPVTP